MLGVARSGYYARQCKKPLMESDYNSKLMRLIDEQYTKQPFFGSRMMASWLRRQGHLVNRKRVSRLMQKMGLQGVGPGPNTSRPHPEHKIYPYLLRDVVIEEVNQVWSTDLTYIPMRRGYMYLTAVIDWHSRYVLAWDVSNSMESYFCVQTLLAALEKGNPRIFNTDQGSQYTSKEFTEVLSSRQIQISMDGRGRALDNIFVERLWRSVKYECIYLSNYETVEELTSGLRDWFRFYNTERPHSSLPGDMTPEEFYYGLRKNTD